ncbi:MAG: ABC transporter substrate-binding protein [Micromonosporaceae bacterium]|nr:ABC transporter substrate-binding protein [Micromonosporaceae bacterium]
MRSRRLCILALLGLLATATFGGTGCGGGGDGSRGSGTAGDPVAVRLGYFPNLTHAPALVGVAKGIFAEKLGRDVRLETKIFSAGPAEVEALFSGAVDIGYIGPNPTINGFAQSGGEALRVISGAASGGAALVVRTTITTAADLKGKKLATPQLGNTQDVALRYWLKQNGLTATREGGGDVSIKPQENADTLTTFTSGAIDGAWVPEPWVTRLLDAGGKVLVDEKTLWPEGRYILTNIVVSTKFLDAHPDVVRKFLAGQVAVNDYLHSNPAESQRAVGDQIGRLTGKPLDARLIQKAWPSLEFTNDPLAATLFVGAKHAEEVGLLQPMMLDRLYDLTLLNEVLKANGAAEVSVP